MREYDGLDVAKFSEWLPLEDVNGIEYGYFIPLKSEGIVDGYAVVSYIGGENKVLKTASGSVPAALASTIIQTASDGFTEGIVYEFPDAFLANRGGEFFKICMNGTMESVEKEDYNVANAEYYLQASQTDKIERARQITPREEISYGQLDDCTIGKFIPIPKGSNSYYYGGYQGWLTDEGVETYYADRSCGVTAAANAMYYMATHITGKAALYNQTGTLTKAKFNAFQKSIYDYLNPSTIGIPTISAMKDNLLFYAKMQGVTLTAVTAPTNWTHDTVLDFIKTGLNAESPVLIINWNSPIEDLVTHWVTITKIYADNASMYMVTSNWGARETYDFNTWVDGSSIYKNAIYFK